MMFVDVSIMDEEAVRRESVSADTESLNHSTNSKHSVVFPLRGNSPGPLLTTQRFTASLSRREIGSKEA